MLQARRDLDFPEEPVSPERLRQLRMHHLQRHGPAMLEILREEDSRHAAAAELALHVIALGERAPQDLEQVGQLVWQWCESGRS